MLRNRYLDKDGKVGILVSPGHGSGWSTDEGNHDRAEFLAMDGTLVDMKFNKVPIEEVKKYYERMLGESFYRGLWEPVVIKWLEPNTAFFIKEYDGYERITTSPRKMMMT